MVQLLTWEWLARDILFQLANDRCIGLPWRRSGRVMVYWMSRDTTTIWDWDWTAWESPRPVHCIHTSRAFVSTSGLKKEFKGKREIDPATAPPPPQRKHSIQLSFFWGGGVEKESTNFSKTLTPLKTNYISDLRTTNGVFWVKKN